MSEGIMSGLGSRNGSDLTVNVKYPYDRFFKCKVSHIIGATSVKGATSVDMSGNIGNVQIKDKTKSTFTLIMSDATVEDCTHFRYSNVYYKILDYKTINRNIKEYYLEFDPYTTLYFMRPKLTGLMTSTVSDNIPIVNDYTPIIGMKRETDSVTSSSGYCLYFSVHDDYNGRIGPGGGDRDWTDTTSCSNKSIYRYVESYPKISLGAILSSIVRTDFLMGGILVDEMWVEPIPPVDVDSVVGTLQLQNIIYPLERVIRREHKVKEVSVGGTDNTINSPHKYRKIYVDYNGENIDIPCSSLSAIGADALYVYYSGTMTPSNPSNIYVASGRRILHRFNVPTITLNTPNQQFSDNFYEYKNRNMVSLAEDIISLIVGMTFNVSTLLEAKKKDYSGVVDSLLGFIIGTASLIATQSDMKNMPLLGGGGVNLYRPDLIISKDVPYTPLVMFNHDVNIISREVQYRMDNPQICRHNIEDEDWTYLGFYPTSHNVYNLITSHGGLHIQGHFTLDSDAVASCDAHEVTMMQQVLRDGFRIIEDVTGGI